MDVDEHISNGSKYINVKDSLSKNKKKKCRGNRKLQRFRRHCRKKGMTKQSIETLISNNNTDRVVQEDTQRIKNKKMDASCLVNTTSNTINMPILSENQNYANESQQDHWERSEVDSTTESCIISPYETVEALLSSPIGIRYKRIKCYNMSTDHWKEIVKLIPIYKNLSPDKFKHMLTKVIPSYYQNQIEHLLTNLTILEVIQQRAQLMCTVFQLKIEQDYWNYISNLISMPTVVWLSEVGKHFTKQNSINWDHTKTHLNVQRRQNIINEKLQQAENNLIFHLQQPYLYYDDRQDQTSMVHFINIISDALHILVDNNLYYLRINFEQKKILLNFDITDAYLVKSFYDLNLTEEQISNAQKIWRAQVKSCKQEIRQQKEDNHLPSTIHEIKMEPIGYEQENQLAPMESAVSSTDMIVDARLRNIKQRAQEMMKFVCTMDDDVFF